MQIISLWIELLSLFDLSWKILKSQLRKLQLLTQMKSSTIFILAVIGFISMDGSYIYGQEEEAKTLDVYVNLNGVADRIEIYEVDVTVYGKEI